MGGGVAANSRLRAGLAAAAEASGRQALLPEVALCTDNGAMIAATAWWRLRSDGPTSLALRRLPLAPAPDPGLSPRGFACAGVGCYRDLALAIAEC